MMISTTMRLNEDCKLVVPPDLSPAQRKIWDAYYAPRNDAFLKNFANDLGGLRAGLLDSKYTVGDFEFARDGVGTGFEAFMVLGVGIYLICNNTQSSMNDIARDPRWLNAQVPFVELSDKVRANPLTQLL